MREKKKDEKLVRMLLTSALHLWLYLRPADGLIESERGSVAVWLRANHHEERERQWTITLGLRLGAECFMCIKFHLWGAKFPLILKIILLGKYYFCSREREKEGENQVSKVKSQPNSMWQLSEPGINPGLSGSKVCPLDHFTFCASYMQEKTQ